MIIWLEEAVEEARWSQPLTSGNLRSGAVFNYAHVLMRVPTIGVRAYPPRAEPPTVSVPELPSGAGGEGIKLAKEQK